MALMMADSNGTAAAVEEDNSRATVTLKNVPINI
jgi:hypothetical protein